MIYRVNADWRVLGFVICVQSAIQTVTLDVTCKVAANVTHPVRLHTCFTLKTTHATVCGLLHGTSNLLASDEIFLF